MKKIGIIGTRKRDSNKDFELCEKAFLSIYEEGDELVSGGCHYGGDKFCEIIASRYNIPIKIYPAEWDKYGKRAGFIRNTYIAQDSDVIIALLPNDGSHSNGTEDTIRKAVGKNAKIILVDKIETIGIIGTDDQKSNFDPFNIG